MAATSHELHFAQGTDRFLDTESVQVHLFRNETIEDVGRLVVTTEEGTEGLILIFQSNDSQ
jgi:hypothetical protein